MLRTQLFHCREHGSIPGQGTKIPQASWLSQKTREKQQYDGREGNSGLVTPPLLNPSPWAPGV